MNVIELIIAFILGIVITMIFQYIVYIQVRDINRQFNELAKDYQVQLKTLINIQKERDYYKRKVNEYEEEEA